MTEHTVLLVDDDETLLELLTGHLQSAGYLALTARNGAEGLGLVAEKQPSLVVLDVMMPGMDGWTVCKRIREESSVPIIMLTAKGEEVDKLRGFHLGVDDYVTKPFSFAEIVARIGAVLARAAHSIPTDLIVSAGNLLIDLSERQVMLDGEKVDLTPTEYRLLEILARFVNKTVPTEKLLQEVWGSEYTGETDHVKQYVWSLRKKLETDPGAPTHILTERGFGYRLE